MRQLTAIRYLYHERFRYYWFAYILRWVPGRLFCTLHYLFRFKRLPSLTAPKTFNEHLIFNKLKCRDAILPFTVDKLSAKDYIRQHVGSGHVVRTLKVFNGPDEISLEGMPSRFVLKATHGCGTNFIVDSLHAELAQLRRVAESWISKDFYWYRREWPYHVIAPRIFAEEFIGEDMQPPEDFKLFVFHGKVEMIEVDIDRFTNHCRALFTADWHLLNVKFQVCRPKTEPCKPDNLDEMIEIAEKLSDGFVFIRIDLYSVAGKIFVGEFTHFPQAGMGRFEPSTFDNELGEVWIQRRSIGQEWFSTVTRGIRRKR